MKSFKDYVKETMTTGPGVAGTSPSDPADWMQGFKKKRRRPLTRSYIEVGGKFRKKMK